MRQGWKVLFLSMCHDVQLPKFTTSSLSSPSNATNFVAPSVFHPFRSSERVTCTAPPLLRRRDMMNDISWWIKKGWLFFCSFIYFKKITFSSTLDLQLSRGDENNSNLCQKWKLIFTGSDQLQFKKISGLLNQIFYQCFPPFGRSDFVSNRHIHGFISVCS